MSVVIPCRIFAAIDDLLVLDDILRSRTISDLVINQELILNCVREFPESVLTAWGPYGDLSVEYVLAAKGLKLRT